MAEVGALALLAFAKGYDSCGSVPEESSAQYERSEISVSVGVFIEHRVQPGQREAVQAVWETHLRPAIEANEAHEAYAYTFDRSDPDVIRAFQQYTDAEAAAAFLRTEAYAAYLEKVEPLLEGPPTVAMVDVMWTKGHVSQG